MKNFLFKINAIVILVSACFLLGRQVLAAPVASVSPSVIDRQGQAREMFEQEVVVKNLSKNRINLYAVVNDIGANDGVVQTMPNAKTDRTTSLTSWIEFTRGMIELDPGQEKKVILKVKVAFDAVPGKYHAQIALAPGPNRPEAENLAFNGDVAKILINLDLADHTVEKIESNLFVTSKNINLGGDIDFIYRLNNIGNRELQPGGHISIFSRNGAEVSEVPVNIDGLVLKAGESQTFSSKWPARKSMGKFKARIQVDYGTQSAQSFEDVIYFWILPLWLVGSIGSIFLALSLIVVYLFIKIFRNNKIEFEFEDLPPERSDTIDLKNRRYE